MQTQKSPNDPHIRIRACGCKFHHYQPIPHFKILLDINFLFIEIREHWNFAVFVGGHFKNGDHSLAIFFCQNILPTLLNIYAKSLAVSDISEVKDFDICSRFPWQWQPFWKFQDLSAYLDMGFHLPVKFSKDRIISLWEFGRTSSQREEEEE